MSHFSASIWKWHWPLIKWPWLCNISHSILSNLLLTSSFVGALIYFYTTSRRASRRSITNGSGHFVPAMLNLGNTCYANSLLQGLASSKTFLKWIRAIDSRLTCGNCKLMFLDALKRIIQDLNDPTKETCSASNVIDALFSHRWSIPPNTEQDLYELFNVFVTTWDEELATLRRSRYSPLEKIVEAEQEEKTSLNLTNSTNITRQSSGDAMLALAKGDARNVPDETRSCASSSNLNSMPDSQFPSLRFLSFEQVKNVVADERQLRPPCMGILAVQLRCCREDCSYKKIREEKFCALSLSLPRSSDPFLTLSKLLQRYFAAEYIQGASCDRCMERKKGSSGGLMKKQGLCKLPPLLILRIERVGFSTSGFVFKRTERFLFPEFIDVREYCFFFSEQNKPKQVRGSLTNPYFRVLGGSALNATSSSTSNVTAQQRHPEQPSSNGDVAMFVDPDGMLKYKYQLRAVSVHIGQAHSGHFITYRRGIGSRNRNSWYRTSDTEITPVSFAEVSSSEAYMLFYDRTLAVLK